MPMTFHISNFITDENIINYNKMELGKEIKVRYLLLIRGAHPKKIREIKIRDRELKKTIKVNEDINHKY